MAEKAETAPLERVGQHPGSATAFADTVVSPFARLLTGQKPKGGQGQPCVTSLANCLQHRLTQARGAVGDHDPGA